MKKIYFLLFMAIPALASAQSFTNSTNLLPDEYNSGGCVGVVDMDQNGYDDIIILNHSNQLNVVYQDAMGNLTETNYGFVSNQNQWGMAIGDLENDGHNDVFSGGSYDGVHLVSINSVGDYSLSDLEEGSMFMQGCNIADINNDGWLDIFACHDDAESRIWGNDGTGNMDPANDWIDMASDPVSDNSGNYGSVWSDFDRDGDTDLFIAKCRQFVSDPYDPRRINTLWVNDGMSNYTDHAYDRGLVLYEQSWTSDFADIDNDGDFDCLITNHSTTMTLLENDGMGHFVDITEGSGLEISEFFLQAKLVDFDNDGYVDLLYAGGGEGYLRNNGDKTFTWVDGTFPYTDEMHSFGIGDLNHDGFMDVYASYGGGYVNPDYDNDDVLWLNDGNDNNWISFQLEGTESNKNAVGAIVQVFGDFGTQVREVRAGESYGINNTFSCHFGLGESDVDYAIIEWPSGILTLIDNPTSNEFHQVIETDCEGPTASISASGSTSLCDGETVDLSLDNTELNFIWSNGATGSTFTVDASGSYSAIVWEDDENCPTYTNTIDVDYYVPVQPTISISGELEFCEGESVQLIASEGMSYEWSNGEETQAITVTEGGTYTVAVQGECDAPIESEEVVVSTWDTPANPTVSDVTIDVAGNAEFNGGIETLRWYETEMSDTPLAEGATFTTPYIDVTTPFWVEDVYASGGEMGTGGPTDVTDEGQYHFSAGYYLLFDAYEDMIIESVVVFANGEAEREIAVVDEFGADVAVGTFNIPDGESTVELNFFVPAGEGYGLRTYTDDPQMWRDGTDDDMDYPYALGDIGSITSSSVDGDNWNNYYYFFYDWTVSTPIVECPSERVEVLAIVLGVEEIEELAALDVFPNPADEQLTLAFDLLQSADVQVRMFDQVGQMVINNDLAQLGAGATNHIVDLQSVEAGVYHLQIAVNGKTISKKIVVQ